MGYIDLVKNRNKEIAAKQAPAKKQAKEVAKVTMAHVRDAAFMYVEAPANKIGNNTPVTQDQVHSILSALYEESSIGDYKMADYKQVNTLGKLFGVLQKTNN